MKSLMSLASFGDRHLQMSRGIETPGDFGPLADEIPQSRCYFRVI
jgi:hypothetical protein